MTAGNSALTHEEEGTDFDPHVFRHRACFFSSFLSLGNAPKDHLVHRFPFEMGKTTVWYTPVGVGEKGKEEKRKRRRRLLRPSHRMQMRDCGWRKGREARRRGLGKGGRSRWWRKDGEVFDAPHRRHRHPVLLLLLPVLTRARPAIFRDYRFDGGFMILSRPCDSRFRVFLFCVERRLASLVSRRLCFCLNLTNTLEHNAVLRLDLAMATCRFLDFV